MKIVFKIVRGYVVNYLSMRMVNKRVNNLFFYKLEVEDCLPTYLLSFPVFLEYSKVVCGSDVIQRLYFRLCKLAGFPNDGSLPNEQF